MDTFWALWQGLLVAVQPLNLLYALIGVTLGTAVGVLPGIGPALTIALLLPITFKLDPAGSLIMFAGIYYGGMYGGSTTSILLNTPGESASIVTAIEGNKMAKAGRGGPALATAAIGSFVAGTLATIALAFVAPRLVKIALAFGPWDYFALMVLAFTTVSAAFGDLRLKGIVSLFIGLTLGLVGIDLQSGQPRLTFGIPDLLDGIEVTTIAVALFAVGETLSVAAASFAKAERIEPVRGSLWMNLRDWQRSWKAWIRGTLIGFPMGALPAGGAEIPTFLSYTLERRLAEKPEEFGNGAIEGVAGPEAANNASAAGTLVPLLTLGLPTTATAAIMLAGFQQYGLQPGPLLFVNRPDLVWGLIASLFIANAMLLVLNLPLIGLWVRVPLDPPALALWRHPHICHPRHDRRQSLASRTRHAARLRPARLCAPPLRLPDRTRDRGADSRPPLGAAAPPRAGDQPGRSLGAGPVLDFDCPLRRGGARALRSLGLAPPPPREPRHRPGGGRLTPPPRMGLQLGPGPGGGAC